MKEVVVPVLLLRNLRFRESQHKVRAFFNNRYQAVNWIFKILNSKEEEDVRKSRCFNQISQ